MHCKCKTYKNCGLLNLFAKTCRKQQTRIAPKSKEKISQHSRRRISTRGLQEFFLQQSREEDNMVATTNNDVEKFEPINFPIRIGNISNTIIVDSGSACIILKKFIAARVDISTRYSIWVSKSKNRNCEIFPTKQLRLCVKIEF